MPSTYLQAKVNIHLIAQKEDSKEKEVTSHYMKNAKRGKQEITNQWVHIKREMK
jgi:hypothetical protein